jgi:SRSO17 transposase
VGLAPQYASSLGKTSNGQSLVSITLAPREVPVMVGLRLFLPESWTIDPERIARAQIPVERRTILSSRKLRLKRSTVSSPPASALDACSRTQDMD